MKYSLRFLCAIILIALLTGCARAPHTTVPVDPYEKLNRQMFALDVGLDRIIFRPAAKIYSAVTPVPLQKGVTNFYDNIQEITTFPNDILQGKWSYAAIDIWRFVLNTTVGFAGLFDPASAAGLPKHYQDFGLTFAYWRGTNATTYLVLPLLGPSTGRDAVGKIGDYAASPWPYIRPYWVSYAAVGLKWVNLRSQLLPADKLVEQAFDPYVFVREAYLQKRNLLIEENKLGDYDRNRVPTEVAPELPYADIDTTDTSTEK